MLRRKLFDFLRKSSTLRTQKAAEHSSTERFQPVRDAIKLSDNLQVISSASPSEELTLEDFANAIFAHAALSGISVDEILAVLLEEISLHYATITEHLTLSDHAAYTWGEGTIDTLTLSDTVLYELTQATQHSETVTDSINLSDIVSFVVETLRTITDSISVSDTVSYEVQVVGEPMIIPDSYAIYNHSNNPVQGDLTVWWDTNTSTSFTIYYTPPDPNNPRYAYLFFVDYPTITKFKIFVPSFTTGKTLIIEVYDIAEQLIYFTTVTLIANEWITVQPDSPLFYTAEVRVYTDSTTIGFVQVAEFQVY